MSIEYGPIELSDGQGSRSGSFLYCKTDGDGQVQPVGHCSPVTVCPKCNGRSRRPDLGGATARMLAGVTDCPECDNRGIVNKADVCPGHPDPATACAHYRQFAIDTAVLVPRAPAAQGPCEFAGCRAPAVGLIALTVPWPAFNPYKLCQRHLDPRFVADNLPRVGRFTL